jgi:pimeloyl-ACP methyl ester carboxylesterase
MVEWFERFRARIGAPTEDRTVDTRFGGAHLLVAGPIDAPSVVVLHGALASSAHALHELAPLLARFRVYAIDIVGQSPMSAEQRPSVANDDYGHWLTDVLDGLGLARTPVVGISFGGFVAIRLAAVAPERIESLALLVPAGMVRGPFWEGMLKIGIPLGIYRAAPSEARLRAFTRHLLTTVDDDWIAFLGDAFRSFDLRMQIPRLATDGELSRLRAPTLVIGAGRDLSFPGEKLVARAATLFPNLVATELLAESNHCPPTTSAFRAWLGDRLTAFLGSDLDDQVVG